MKFMSTQENSSHIPPRDVVAVVRDKSFSRGYVRGGQTSDTISSDTGEQHAEELTQTAQRVFREAKLADKMPEDAARAHDRRRGRI